MKSSNVLGYLNVICYASCFWLECNCMKECNVKHKMQQENQHCSWQLSQLKSVQLDLIIVTHSSQVALNIFFKNYKWSKTQLQDSSSKLINKIMFHLSSELFTGCPFKHVSSISCQHSVTPSSLIQPLFICLSFSVSTLHQDSCAPPLTQKLRIPHIKTKTFGHRSFSKTAPSFWNSLPREIRHIQSTTAFKTALKTHLLKSYLY